MDERNRTLPMVPLADLVVFPNVITNFEVQKSGAIKALETAIRSDALVFFVLQKESGIERPHREELHENGVVAQIRHIIRESNGTVRVLVNGVYKARLGEVSGTDYLQAEVLKYQESGENPEYIKACARSLIDKYREYIKHNPKIAEESVNLLEEVNDPARLMDLVAVNVLKKTADKQSYLDRYTLSDQFRFLLNYLNYEVNIIELEADILKQTKQSLDKSQREYYLREQLRSIKNSLGENSEEQFDKIRQFIEHAPLPEDAKKKLLDDLARAEAFSPQSAEYAALMGYFEWITSLPFGKYSKDSFDVKRAARTLDKTHYGMKNVKSRILEYLSVMKLTGRTQGSILCFIGPPGVGKTSIAKSIAAALGRKFVRMSLGGVRDEAEIRGHRRTYIGAIPGRIVSNIRRAGTMNPVFLLDEIDKMSSDYKGDPASAMLEVLDEEVNATFQDHYLDIDFDLSKVMFIATANNADAIPEPLYDRMEIIELESYTPYEKEKIAEKYLLKKQFQKNGLTNQMLLIEKSVVREIIASYTAESGVRALERLIGEICRRAAKLYLDKGERVTVKKTNLTDFIGLPKVRSVGLPEEDMPGVSIGLAWTYGGGTTMPIEVGVLEGSGNTQLTGQMGEVMQESAKAAISVVRSMAKKLGIKADFYKHKDIHIHIPEGAVPKDGPSAGITMAVALASALSGQKVSKSHAMTGEITLTGRVLAVGGLREKTFAAYRAGIENVILPKANMADLKELPEEIASKLTFLPVENIEQVFDLVLRGKRQEKA